MYFFIEPTKQLNKGKLILYPDSSFGIENSEAWDFQISIEQYPVLLLNINRKSGQCVGIEGVCWHDKKIRKTMYQSIFLNNSTNGTLYVSGIPTDPDLFGVSYQLENAQEYFDKENQIFAIGDMSNSGQLWQIGMGQYVKINNHQLVAIYIHFNKL